ncbi:substrate-binding domain-containing protein [Clostridium intestinale]|uniref:substrate-binding domain-containing protein n=1 Tax=Clostridium intestinale TaxID=36845 RepID=UPI0028E544F2|nr:substrate-binding domain-containing protein [Clostridium intestinale]
MYLSIPEVFYCQVRYVKQAILDINYSFFLRENGYKNIKIGVVLPSSEVKRWNIAKASMEKEAFAKGIKIRVEFSNWDINKEIEIIKELILENIDVLVLTAVKLKGGNEILNEVHKAGIKIIAMDALVHDSPVDLFAGFNMLKAGELQGSFLTKKVPEGRYIILYGSPNGEVFRIGAMEYISPLVYTGKIHIVADEEVQNWLPENAYEIVKKVLLKDKNINAILAPVDKIAGGAIKALKEENMQGKVIVTGQDAEPEAIKRIMEGTQAMTLLNDSLKLGQITIDLSINLIEGKSINYDYMINNGKVDVKSVLIDPILIDKENVFNKINELKEQ